MPAGDAFVVARLREAGAIVLGKTNLDQFATGLVGVRSPFPVPRNAIDPDIVPGGSSSGSAVAVARGIATFALGTDTAGSGRVPAALNAIVGLKPTLGALSASGVVPACRTLDTVSIFATTVADAWAVYGVAAGYDAADAYSRPVATGVLFDASSARIGVPDAATLLTYGDEVQAADFRRTVERLREAGAVVRELDFSPFYAVARMLYEGAWLAERVAAVGERLTARPETLHPTTRAILEPGLELSAVDAFEGFYRLNALRRDCEAVLAGVDALCVPTIPSFVTLAEIAADPVGPNSRLGTYTNFVNLLDLCGVSVPTGSRTDGRPGSVTILAASGRDALCASIASALEAGPLGATGWVRPAPSPLALQAAAGEMALAVCGSHMAGLPLNRELVERGGRLIRATSTAPAYRLHALAGGPPIRPGLVRSTRGASVALEVWALPRERFGDFIAGVPSPLCIGTVELADGTTVKGFLCEEAGLAGASDITEFGGWRAWLARPKAEAAA
jgi:allophanate hydrolase